jgi:hypothetical protein
MDEEDDNIGLTFANDELANTTNLYLCLVTRPRQKSGISRGWLNEFV